ncbi:Gfo/Idh/MocA family oxidoreductase [Pseudonocardia ailaonensis]|uniref:Gfo/Idh/MocA family oxidoreductase n=1 Tax=Pseudonocardia ailaonensis TaxID=367279 RepID=A0ABN2NF34_9PSEU
MRIGVVGASYAQGTHLPVYAALAAEGVVELVAVATAHRETAEAVAEKYGARPHVGFEALCADPDVDLVDVATRPSGHREMVLAALDAGKDVLCEAPLAPTVADGEAMAAALGGQRGIVDMQSRFRHGLVELRRLVRDGFVGRVDNVAVEAFYPTFTQPAAVAGSGWCADARFGASSLRVHGLHTTDLLRWTFGELTDVRGTVATRQPEWPGGVAATSVDSAAYTARTADGAVVSLHTSWVAPFGAGFRLLVHGSGGMLLAEAAGHTGHFPVRLSGTRDGDLRELVPAEGGATDPFAALVRALAVGDHTDLPTFADGIAALRVADAAEAAG